MKKILIIFTFVMLLCLCACASSGVQSSMDSPPIGEMTDPTQGHSEPTQERPMKHFLLTEEMRYDSKGAPYYKNTYTYDDHGRMITRNHILFAYADHPEVSFTETYSYNEQGFLIGLQTDEEDSFNLSYQYNYNNDGTVSSYTCIADHGEFTYYLSYEDGRLTRVHTLDDMGNEKQKFAFEYDQNGNLTNFVGEEFAVVTITYDDQNRVSKLFGEQTRQYQYEQKRISSVENPEGMRWSFGYTDEILSSIIFMSEINVEFGEFAAKTYELDSNGKIVKIQYDNGGWFEYQYQETDVEMNDLRYSYFNMLNEPLWAGDYYRNPVWYVLPKVELDQPH